MSSLTGPCATVIIPAHNEAGYIRCCIEAVLASAGGVPFEVIVVANGCTDATARIARQVSGTELRPVRVIETGKGGKPGALQLGDDAANGAVRVYLDADVIVSPPLIPSLIQALDTEAPRYASGRPVVATPASAITRHYARFWQRLPFFNEDVPGFGIFAVNAAGRKRWGRWPDIISDDTYARLNFAPWERLLVDARYTWPMVEGLSPLVRVRRRQDRGVRQIECRFEPLVRNRERVPGGVGRKALAALRDPVGFAVYALVALRVRLAGRGRPGAWERGR